MDAEVTDVTLTCVREFLKRRGLTRSLATLDDEAPRREGSISKRSELAKFLHIEKLLAVHTRQPPTSSPMP